MNDSKIIKVIESYNVKGIGYLVELQHHYNGIETNTSLVNRNNKEQRWTLKGRVLNGFLLVHSKEIIFENEDVISHYSPRYSSEAARQQALKKFLEKQEQKIYSYVFFNPKNSVKPAIGTELIISE